MDSPFPVSESDEVCEFDSGTPWIDRARAARGRLAPTAAIAPPNRTRRRDMVVFSFAFLTETPNVSVDRIFLRDLRAWFQSVLGGFYLSTADPLRFFCNRWAKSLTTESRYVGLGQTSRHNHLAFAERWGLTYFEGVLGFQRRYCDMPHRISSLEDQSTMTTSKPLR